MIRSKNIRLLIALILFVVWLGSAEAEVVQGAESTLGDERPAWISASRLDKKDLGDVDALAGATQAQVELELLPGYDVTDLILGEEVDLKFYSGDFVVKSYSISGSLPPGLRLSSEVNKYGVGSIVGTPKEAGTWLFSIVGWEGEVDVSEASEPLSLFVGVDSLGPEFAKQPENQVAGWGGALRLSARLVDDTNVSFQWEKDGFELAGSTGAALSIDQARSIDQGIYRLVATGPNGKSYSDEVFVFVRANSYQRWAEAIFQNPFDESSGSDSDLDGDGNVNLLEYALQTDPELKDRERVFGWEIENEKGGWSILMPEVARASDLVVEVQFWDLENGGWKSYLDLGYDVDVSENGDRLIHGILGESILCRIAVKLL